MEGREIHRASKFEDLGFLKFYLYTEGQSTNSSEFIILLASPFALMSCQTW